MFQPSDEHTSELYKLSQRRKELKQLLVAEKNRVQTSNTDYIKESHEKLIDHVSQQVKLLDQKIDSIINENKSLCDKKEILQLE